MLKLLSQRFEDTLEGLYLLEKVVHMSWYVFDLVAYVVY